MVWAAVEVFYLWPIGGRPCLPENWPATNKSFPNNLPARPRDKAPDASNSAISAKNSDLRSSLMAKRPRWKSKVMSSMSTLPPTSVLSLMPIPRSRHAAVTSWHSSYTASKREMSFVQASRKSVVKKWVSIRCQAKRVPNHHEVHPTVCLFLAAAV